MYFPIGWSKTLRIRLKSNGSVGPNAGTENGPENNDDDERLYRDEKLLSIKTSSDKSFLCVLTNFSLRIWFCKVRLFCAYRRLFSLLRTLGASTSVLPLFKLLAQTIQIVQAELLATSVLPFAATICLTH